MTKKAITPRRLWVTQPTAIAASKAIAISLMYDCFMFQMIDGTTNKRYAGKEPVSCVGQKESL